MSENQSRKQYKTIPGPLVQTVAALSRPPATPKTSSFYDIPSTSICLLAEKVALQEIPDWIANHCFRSYAFALAVANYAGFDTDKAKEELGFDKELLFLTCALHEWGMCEEGINQSKLSLELWSAIRAREWIREQSKRGSPRSSQKLCEWADLSAEAIARHSIEFRGFSKQVNINTALLTIGSGHDLMGLFSAFIHPNDINLICARWPRVGYVDGLRDLARVEVLKKPGCLFEGCQENFDPGMYHVQCFQGLQGKLREERPGAKL
jgi:cyanamide hydratase